MSRPAIRLNTQQKAARDKAVGDLVHRTTAIIQRSYAKLLTVGIDGPIIVVDYHWRPKVPKPFYRHPGTLNVPLVECTFMHETTYETALLEAMAMYAAWVEYDAVDMAFRRAVDVRHARRPMKVYQGNSAYSDFLRILKRP